ncbi:hypothetical protein GGI20_005894, partial [Coemansia sp. BCRC 34301]
MLDTINKENEREKKIEALEALQRHDERVAKTAEVVREIISRKDPNRISYYDAGPVERFVGVPLTFDCSCEFSNVEPEPTYHVDGHVKGFRRKTINDLIPQMKTMFDEAFSYTPRRRRPIAYFIFQIMNNGRRYASTPAVDVESTRIEESVDLLYTYFDNLMQRIKEEGEGYENIIAANNHHVMNVFNIDKYSDLMIDSLSPVKNFIVMDPDVVFLLNWKGHVGVLENMKEQKRNQFRTSFRPLQKYPKCKKVTVCFDIECYFDPYSKTEGTRHTPYLCCACFVYDDNPGDVIEFEGRDCVAQMIDWCAELAVQFKHNSIELIAHNGGGYDFHYILSSMYNPAVVKDVLIRNNHFISFKFKHMDIQFSVKDSLNFLLCSLSKAAKAFLLNKDGTVNLDKTDFPHHEMKTSDDLQKTFREWIKIDQMVNVDIEKEKMLITSDHVVKYNENGEFRKMIDWAKEYCCNDVIVLAMVWVKFKQTVADIFNCHIVDQTYTLAGLSFRLFEAHLPHGIHLKHPIKEDFMNMRESLIGGRCISVNG